MLLLVLHVNHVATGRIRQPCCYWFYTTTMLLLVLYDNHVATGCTTAMLLLVLYDNHFATGLIRQHNISGSKILFLVSIIHRHQN